MRRMCTVLLLVATLGGVMVVGAPAALAATGGPDAFGYTFVDSASPGGPAYNFEDISSTGTNTGITCDDCVGGAYPLGFAFSFYGSSYTQFYVSSNGFMTFLSGQSNGCCSGGLIPQNDGQNGLVAGYWEDLVAYCGGGPIRYQTVGSAPHRRLIVQFNTPHYSSCASPIAIFQIKLFESTNVIEIHYDSANSDGGTHTAGIENQTGSTGLQYFRGNVSLQDVAVRFSAIPDTTPPSITPTVTGTLGSNGYYTGDATVSWTVSDGQSQVTSSSGCGTTVVSSDTDGTTFTCSATSAGGSNSSSVTVKRDATKPSLTVDASPSAPDGSNGWYVSSPTIDFECSDPTSPGSGLASCTIDGSTSNSVTLGESSTAQSVSATATDAAGNSDSETATGLLVDLSDPTMACGTTAPVFTINETAQVLASVSDAISGPVSPSASAPADTGSVGSGSVVVTGYDTAGRSASISCPYSVVYDFVGFETPVDGGGTLNRAKAGQSVPLKWRLLDAAGAPVTTLSSAGVTVASLSCSGGFTADQLEEYAAGSSGLQNLGDGYYQFNWKTPKTYASSCKTMSLNLGEGFAHTALFQFVK